MDTKPTQGPSSTRLMVRRKNCCVRKPSAGLRAPQRLCQGPGQGGAKLLKKGECWPGLARCGPEAELWIASRGQVMDWLLFVLVFLAIGTVWNYRGEKSL